MDIYWAIKFRQHASCIAGRYRPASLVTKQKQDLGLDSAEAPGVFVEYLRPYWFRYCSMDGILDV